MSRRIFRILSSLGLNTFFLFMLVSTSAPALAHNIATKPHSSITPHNIATNVICAPEEFIGGGWHQTGNGPASFGCGGHAWEVNTPTTSEVGYWFGVTANITRTYTLHAFITNHATAPMDYDVWIGDRHVGAYFFNQANATFMVPVCTFTISAGDSGDLWIYEKSGAAHTFTMSASAVQLT